MNFGFYHAMIVMLLLVLASGCSSTNDESSSFNEVSLDNSNPSIVILGRRHVSHNETEFDYISCVGENISERDPSLNIIPEQYFINAMYPYFEESTAPLNISNFEKVSKMPAVAEKLNKLNLRYLVWIDGNTEKQNQSGAVSCAIGPGGGGCFGFSSWDEEADYQAKIWDLENLSLSGNINTERSGTSYMPAIIIPIPLLAGVQDTACNDMARRIEQSINT